MGFAQHINYPGGTTTLGSPYTAASGSFALATGTGAAFMAGLTPTATDPVRFTVASALTPSTCTHYSCTGRTSDTLTGVTVLSGTDRGYAAGSSVYGSLYAEDLRDIEAAAAPAGSAGQVQVNAGAGAFGALAGSAGQLLATAAGGLTAISTALVEIYTTASPNATGIGSVVANATSGGSASGGYSFSSSGGAASNVNSHADSSGVADGTYSHADSGGTASGTNSHAEGGGIASGSHAHADSASTASGHSSHANSNGISSGFGSCADSQGTASGNFSHADSGGTAGGDDSHADSGGTTYGGLAHSEGDGSVSLGVSAHSEGGSFAAANTSHSEGSGSTAAGVNAHVGGLNCWAGPVGYPADLATTDGVTVATIAGADVAAWFAPADNAVLANIDGATGPIHVIGTIVTSAFDGTNTVVTFGSIATDGTTATLFDPAMALYGRASGVNTLADLQCKSARGDGGFSVAGAAPVLGSGQHSTTPLSVVTADDAATELLISGGQVGWSGSTTPARRFLLPDAVTYGFEATIAARQSDGSAHALFRRMGLVHRDGGTVALEGSVGTIGADINAPGWAVAITADDAHKSLKLAVTGAAATTIHWQARLDCVEVGAARNPLLMASPVVS